jgi:hypothetical protein
VLRHSQSNTENPDVTDVTDSFRDTDNAAFFEAAVAELGDTDGVGLIGLVGSCDLPGVAMRRAQSILRWDRRPSLWSHAFLIVEPIRNGDAEIREVAVHSRSGQFPEPAYNAVTKARLSHYASPRVDANVALLSVRMTEEERAAVVARAVEDPNLDRLRFDLFETLGYWQAYLWTRGTPNPLEQGIPVHSSALVEYCFEAIALDLTPGANDRNSAPEHLWNSARWWSEEFGELNRQIRGRYVLRDQHCTVLNPGEA